MNARGAARPGTDRGSVIAGCVAIGVSVATLGIPANLNGLFAERLHVSGAELTWIGGAHFAAAAVSVYLIGSLADRFGRKRILLLSSLLVAIGQSASSPRCAPRPSGTSPSPSPETAPPGRSRSTPPRSG